MNNVIDFIDMRHLIKRILREELTSSVRCEKKIDNIDNIILEQQDENKSNVLKDKLKKLTDEAGLAKAARYVGGFDKYVDIMFDGDLIKFGEETKTPIAYLSVDGMSFYIHQVLVDELNLGSRDFFNRKEKELGDFRFGSKNGFQYKFHARLQPAILHDKPYYKVVGMSGDSGFGYGFLTKKETLGKRYRQQIFNQIIDKYDLKPYMNVKTFY